MAKHKKLEDYRDQIEQCVKCGACQAHCPVFGEHKRESIVARGKVALAHALLNDEVKLDERLVEDMSKCLMCASCFDKCPNLVPTDEIVAAARREITEKQGLSNFGKALTTVIKNPKLMNALAKSGSAFSALLFKKVPEQSGLRLRFPVPFVSRERSIPAVAAKPFRERHPEVIPGEAGKPTVAFFTGCMINYMYPEIGDALLKILKFMGVTVLIPGDQGCCGMPAISAGDGATVEELSQRNLAALTRRTPDVIITACATCNEGIGRHFKHLEGDYATMADKVMDMNVFLVRHGLDKRLAELPRKEVFQRVTYHDPCHLRTQGITKEPRALLKALPGVRFIEMEGADRCCGLGGTFSVYHYDTSKLIGARKAPGIEQSGADLVATACPGCMMQLQDTINHAGLKPRVIHLLELIARDLPA
ncbi:(Fe-S)-binding protein [Geoalkalibacter halelectricus]|uniref:Glycolate oxidase iron-sulfur subunit n=1 Tax=Geoalkalibacter halelectricus TaxID=2847045 RepID=A0ABY5ZKF8_9BACT|nr:(Fe-S)-binding protein [Geoalkalibacter halelectricus]MDO3377994.1 (Fe-S)-binding protein [Geoalkalibacter halelectricus]UWZ78295.1 (Fe-S)-binding protein [Geoalkalibacter halelectricus]